MFDAHKLILAAEKLILILIALFTLLAVGIELKTMWVRQDVKLTDLLLLFIYAEVLGMVAAFYASREIPIVIAVFVAITAMCRLIILSKDASTIDLIYESSAVLLLSLSVVAIQWYRQRNASSAGGQSG